MTNQLTAFSPNSARFAMYLEKYMPFYGINTLLRKRHFLAQVAHESGSFRYVSELASGVAYDTGSKAKMLGNTPEADGDGQKYRGRGLIQVTGKSNYKACSIALFGDTRLMDKPELLEQPEWAVKSACWFWWAHGLNRLADTDNIEAVTKRVNGGRNGLVSRKLYYEHAKSVII